MKKLPKSMGACADLLYDTRQARLAKEKEAAALKIEEERIKTHIIDNLDKREDTGAAGKRYRAQIKRRRKWRVNAERWDKFFTWVGKQGRFDLLQKRLSEQAINELMETAPKRSQPPGIEPFDFVDISLTKV